MLKIAITPEHCNDPRREARQICTLISEGWDRIHLRHPGATRSEMRTLIEAVPAGMHKRLVIHDHFSLAGEFGLGGLHLNRRSPIPPDGYYGSLSRSCHSISELTANTGMAYLTLSPVFDSISKTGYASAFTTGQLEQLSGIPATIIALGGVTPERIPLLRRYNFSGFAMLGAIPWNADDGEMSRFIKLIQTKS